MSELRRIFENGIIKENAVLVLLIGMCPVFAITTQAENGIGMGIATTFVLICSNILVSMLRKVIPNEVRLPCYIVIISGFSTIVGLLLAAFAPALNESLGVYISLIVVNCIIMFRAEAFAGKNTVLRSAADGLAVGIGFTLALLAVGSVRELLGSGSIFGVKIAFIGEPLSIFAQPAGAFFTLAFVAALVQWARRRKKK